MSRLLYISILFIAFSCSNKPKQQEWTLEQIQQFNERSVAVNRDIVRLMQDTIQSYIAKQNWTMQASGTGLWYAIDRRGGTDTIKKGDIVEIAYTVSLLNGHQCYSSDSLGPKVFKVGQGGVESGLEEAMLMLCKGDSARLLIPPHLAHGLIGDQQCIPKLAILNYTLVVRRHKPKE